MKWIDYSFDAKGNKEPYVVEIGEDRIEKFNLPEGLAIRTTNGGKVMTVLPAKHLLADEGDVTFDEAFIAECQRAFDKHPLDLLNDTALDLASRKLAVKPFQKEGSSSFVDAALWAADHKDVLDAYKTKRLADKPAADAWLKEEYRKSL